MSKLCDSASRVYGLRVRTYMFLNTVSDSLFILFQVIIMIEFRCVKVALELEVRMIKL